MDWIYRKQLLGRKELGLAGSIRGELTGVSTVNYSSDMTPGFLESLRVKPKERKLPLMIVEEARDKKIKCSCRVCMSKAEVSKVELVNKSEQVFNEQGKLKFYWTGLTNNCIHGGEPRACKVCMRKARVKVMDSEVISTDYLNDRRSLREYLFPKYYSGKYK